MGYTEKHEDGKRDVVWTGNFELIESDMAFTVNYGNYFWVTPFFYDITRIGGLQIEKSKGYRLGNKLTVCLVTISALAQVGFILNEWLSGKMLLHNLVGPYRLLSTLLCTLTWVFQLNLMLKADMMPQAWWSILSFAGKFKGSQVSKMERMEKRSHLLMNLFMATLLTLQLSFVGLYLYKCEFHVLEGVMPTCKARIFFLALQIFLTSQLVGSAAFTANVILKAVQVCQCTLEVLKSKPFDSPTRVKGVKISTKQRNAWYIRYSCFRIFATNIQECFGDLVIPQFFLVAVVVFALSNYIIVSPASLLVTRCFSAIIIVILVAFIALVIQDATFFPKLSADILRQRKSCCLTRTSTEYRFMNSCSTIRIYVGRFFYLQSELVIQMVSIVVNYTISLLIS